MAISFKGAHFPQDIILMGVRADPAKFEAESATSETHKWVAPDAQ